MQLSMLFGTSSVLFSAAFLQYTTVLLSAAIFQYTTVLLSFVLLCTVRRIFCSVLFSFNEPMVYTVLGYFSTVRNFSAY